MYSSNKYAASHSTKREKIKDTVKSCDRYGKGVGFQIQTKQGSKSELNTVCGSLTHIIVLTVMLIYGMNKFNKLLNHEDTQFHQNTDYNSIDSDTVFSIETLDFNVAFGIQNNEHGVDDDWKDYVEWIAIKGTKLKAD